MALSGPSSQVAPSSSATATKASFDWPSRSSMETASIYEEKTQLIDHYELEHDETAARSVRENLTCWTLVRIEFLYLLSLLLRVSSRATGVRSLRLLNDRVMHAGWHTPFPSSTQLALSCLIKDLQTTAEYLLPSFLVSRLHSSVKQDPPRPTAFLDGLRGVAAFIVYCHHISYWFFWIKSGWTPEHHHNWYSLPILTLVKAGPACVTVFFVVSGYSLSLKPIRQMRQGQAAAPLGTLQSMIFRRAFRLYLPIIASTFIYMLCINAGFFDATRHAWEDKAIFTGITQEIHQSAPSHFFSSETGGLFHWLKDIIHVCVTRTTSNNDFGSWYDIHLWTIPTEFYASISLFVVLVAFAPCRSAVRFTGLVVLAVLAAVYDYYHMLLFFSGALLVELNYMIADCAPSQLPTARPKPKKSSSLLSLGPDRSRSFAMAILGAGSFLTSLYLLSTPEWEYDRASFGYSVLTQYVPPGIAQPFRFWWSIGSVLLLFMISNVAFLRRLFSTAVCRYLGRISFAFYLVHGLVSHLVGFVTFRAILSGIDQTSTTIYALGWTAAFVVTTACVIWAADLFTRTVDEPVIRLARRLEDMSHSS